MLPFFVILLALTLFIFLFFYELRFRERRFLLECLQKNQEHFKIIVDQLDATIKYHCAENIMSISKKSYGDYLLWLHEEFSDNEFEMVVNRVQYSFNLKSTYHLRRKFMHTIVDEMMVMKYCIYLLEVRTEKGVVNF